MQSMRITIRSGVLLLVLSVLLPAVATAFFIIVHIERSERAALQRNLRDTTRALSNALDAELDRRAATARMLALSPLLDAGAATHPAELARFAELARDAMQGLGGWVELRSNAGLLMTTAPPAADQPPAAAGAAQQPLLDAPVIAGLQQRNSGDQPLVAVVQPTLQLGRPVLNLTVTLLPAELQRIIDRQQFPPGWSGAVFTGQGFVAARWPGGAAYVGQPARGLLRTAMAARDEGLFEGVSLDDAPVTAYFNKSAHGWTAVTAMPRPQSVLGVPATLAQLVLGSLVLLACAVAGALWAARRIVGPVALLKDAAARMRAGEPVHQCATGIREFDDVAAALAQAAHSAQQAQLQLEARVADAVSRTRVAEQAMSQRQRVEALGRLTGGIAHDFNNLLGVISNSAHLMQRRDTGHDLKAPLAATLRAVDAGSRLTRHLRRFAGQQPASRLRIDLAQALPDAQDLLSIVLGKRIELAVAVAPQTLPIHVDPGELELALINLALNARDALPSGGHVWLGARNAGDNDAAGLPPGSARVLLTFSDDGVGVDDSIVNRVFEPFFTTKQTGQGTGLGLSQVHGFCKQSGGSAELGSTPGLGTTVSLLLPAATGDEQPAPAAHPDPLGQPRRQQPLQQRMARVRVLVVDDNAELADVTAVLLRADGCTVTIANSPEQALTKVDADQPFDVVLSDVLMPGAMDGVALAQELRQRQPALPVVLISGHSSALHRVQGFPVLHKPCPPDELIATLLAAIDIRRSRLSPLTTTPQH